MALQDTVRFLGNIPTLRELEPDALRLIAFSAEMQILRTGQPLFRRGDASDGGYILLSGTIAMQTDDGTATLVKPPVLIGECALMIETLRPTDAVAHEASSVLKVSREMFRRAMAEHPASAARLHRALIARLDTLQRDLDAVVIDASS